MKHLKLFFALFAMLALGVGNAWAETAISFGFSNWDDVTESFSSTDKDEVTQTVDGIKVTYTRNGSSLYANTSAIRFYKSNTLKFDAPTGYSIQSIAFTCTSYKTDITSDVGTCTATSSNLSWSGDATSVTFTRPSSASNYATITGATVTLAATSGGSTPDPGTGEGGEDPETPGTGGTVTYTVSSVTAVTTTGNVPQGSTAVLSGTGSLLSGFIQCSNGKNHTLTLTGYEGYMITGVTIHVKSNSSKGTGSFSVMAGSTTIASITESAFNTSSWNGSWNTTGVDKTLTMTNDSYEIQSGENVTLTINCKSGSTNYNSLYVKSYTITYKPVSSSGSGSEEPAYSVTVNQPAEGGGIIEADKDKATKDATVTLTATPDEGYKFSAWDVKDASSNPVSVDANGQFTMPESNVTVTASFVARTQYTISWSVNGETKTLSPANVYEGDALGTLPTPDPSDICTGKVFVGWTTATNNDYKHTTDAPEFITKDTKPSGNTTYYAVFATEGEDQTTSIAGGDWSTGADGDWSTYGTGLYSGNGVKFDDANDYVMSPDISSNAYTRLLLKFKSGHNGGEGSVLKFYAYNKNNKQLTGDDITISPETVVPTEAYTQQNTIYQVNISANEVIGKIMIRMDSKTKNLGMSYCEIFGVSTSYSNYSTTCASSVEYVELGDDFKWSATEAEVTIDATDNVFPTLTNTHNVPVTYSSSDDVIASIASDGTVTLKKEGTVTITAKYAGGTSAGTGKEYKAKTVDYTLTVKQLVSCADIYNLADDATFVLKDFVVTYVNGDYTYIKDATGYGVIYKNSYGLQAGDQVASGKLEGKKDTYKGLVEIIPTTTAADLNATSGIAPEPEVMTNTPTNADINKYVKFENVSFKYTNLNDTYKTNSGKLEGQTEYNIAFYNKFTSNVTFDTSKKYDVVGVVSIKDDAIEVYFISAEEVAEPTLNVKITDTDFGKIAINGKAERTLTLNGSLLTKPVSLAIEGDYFTLESNSVTPVDGKIEEEKIKITFKPTAEGTHTATLKITSDELAEQTITLQGQAVQQHTVHFFVNGEEDETLAKKVLSGEKLTEIPTATSCDPLEYPTFIGWSASEITGTTDVEPTDLLDLNTTITADCNYYAVFAKETTTSSSSESATMAYSGTTTNMTDGNNASTVGLDEALFTITSDKGGQGNHVGLNKAGDIRLYANKTDGNGNILTIAMAEGYTITQISLYIKESATFVVKANGQSITGTENVYDINHSSCSIQNTTTGATTQLKLNSITISYTTSTISKEYLTTCESATPTYTVTYNLDGGESTCETSVVVEQNGELTLCDAPTKKGHTFLKWKDQSDNEYEAGAKITVSEDLTLTAQWQVNSYSVTWISLGEEVESNSANYNTQPTKPTTAPSYTCGIGSKEFVGWTTQEIDGVGVPANLYTDEFPVVTEPITYYAVFASKIEGGGSMSKAVSLTNGETIYLATESGIGVTGAVADGKDATVSTTQGDWMPFTVVTNGLQYQFKNGDNYITAAAKSFKITETPSDFAFENGYIVYNVPSGSDPGDYVLLYNSNSGSFYRFYKKSNIGKENYETFYVYKNPTHTDFVTTCEEEPDIEIDYNPVANPTTLSGVFSVAADKKVQFSTGNLQYEVGTNTWLFASEQYEVIGGDAYTGSNNTNYGMNVPNYTGKLDLFAWSCDGKYGVNPSNTDSDYQGTFVDWGTLAGEGWFTLTKEEMNYILNRTKNGKKLWALATIDKLPGLILLPDNWNTNITLNYGYIPTQFVYNENLFTAKEWEILEVAGAVFLPAAGSRTGGYGNKDNAGFKESYDANGDYFHVDNVGIYGYYWLDTQDPRPNFKHCASYLILPGWDEGPTVDEEGLDDLSTHPQVWSREKRRGNSVRLVKTVEEDPTTTVSGRWELVTAESTLAVGDKVVIVAKESDYALSTTQKSNNRDQAAVTKNNNTISFSADVQVLTLEIGDVDNTFALNTGNGYLYAASSSENYLRTETKLSVNSSWAIAVSEDGTATIVAKGSYTRNVMQYNQSSSLFACYASTSQKALCLYRKTNVKVESNQTTTNDIPNYSDVTVGSTGQLNVEKPLIVENLYIQTTMGATSTSAQISNATNTNLLINGDVFIDITLGNNGEPSQWHAFTVPFPVDAMNGVYDLNDNKLTNEVNYAIMDYHGDLRANGQYGWKKYRGILVPGTFYLMTVDGARTTYRFKKVEDAAIVAPATKAITAFTGSGDATKDKGWNGVGNPTLMHGKVGYKALILNPESYTYEAIPENTAYFTVGTPFFIQAAENGTMTMDAETSASLAPARRAAAAVENIKVMLGNSDYTDRLYVSASEDAINEYEIGKDLGKMAMTSTPSVVQISALAYDTRLCMIDAPMANNEALVALNLYAPANGEYTLSIEAQDNEKVYLLHEGTFVWDLSMSEYPITLNKGDNAGYSILVHRADAPTSVETIDGANNQTEKLIHNGNLYILHNGKVFDAVGTMLK